MDAPVTGLKIGYARVSTDDQRLELQTDALVKAGVERLRIYTDKASGATVDRPGFIACFKALRPGDTLVIWKLDRLGRNLSQLLQTAERLEAKQCRLLVVTEAIDTSTPMGRFMFKESFKLSASVAQEVAAALRLASAIREDERKGILERARKSIRVRLGRAPIPEDKLKVARALWTDDAVTAEAVSTRVGVSVRTLYRYLGPKGSPIFGKKK